MSRFGIFYSFWANCTLFFGNRKMLRVFNAAIKFLPWSNQSTVSTIWNWCICDTVLWVIFWLKYIGLAGAHYWPLYLIKWTYDVSQLLCSELLHFIPHFYNFTCQEFVVCFSLLIWQVRCIAVEWNSLHVSVKV